MTYRPYSNAPDLEMDPAEWEDELDGVDNSDLWSVLKLLDEGGLINWDRERFEDDGELHIERFDDRHENIFACLESILDRNLYQGITRLLGHDNKAVQEMVRDAIGDKLEELE